MKPQIKVKAEYVLFANPSGLRPGEVTTDETSILAAISEVSFCGSFINLGRSEGGLSLMLGIPRVRREYHKARSENSPGWSTIICS